MTEKEKFTLVGILPEKKTDTQSEPTNPFTKHIVRKKKTYRSEKIPFVSFLLLGILIFGCLFAELIMPKDPAYMDLAHYTQQPGKEFWFGTDTLGRDIFSCIWYGGRISLFIGFFSTAISTAIAVIYGTISGVAPDWLDSVLMRLTEILLSVPSLLIVIFLQAILGDANVLSISLVIGVTSWYSIAKVVRTEVRRLRHSEYVIAAKCMGGGFFHILFCHYIPNFISSIMFMVVMNIRSAIVAESTLSFMGLGLPLGIISWGSMLSLAENALMSRAWWIILIPGVFLVTLLMCITDIGNWLRQSANRQASVL